MDGGDEVGVESDCNWKGDDEGMSGDTLIEFTIIMEVFILSLDWCVIF